MLNFIRTRVQQGTRTADFPGGKPALPERFRGRPALDRSRCADCAKCGATMPSELKWRGGGKYILKRLASGLIPADIITRPKHGFRLPLDRWFRAELRPLAEDLLLSTRTRGRGFFAPAPVEELWRRYLAGDDDRFMQVWTLVNFEIWCRGFLDSAAVPT